MHNVSFLNSAWVHLVWLAAALVAVLSWLELRGHDALARFMSATMQRRLSERPTIARRVGRLALILVSLVTGILGLMRPQSPGGIETLSNRASADIMVVLDASKSMLAEDAAPNRLARARAEIIEMIDRLPGHRVGLVAFAGRAVVLCPLTPDYGFFRNVLKSANPSAVARGGTRIGDAIRKGVEAFGPGRGAKLMLLITDGEDHDSFPRDAAKQALEAGVRIVTVGFGSEQGSEITLVDPHTGGRSTLTDANGQVVRTRLDGELLRDIALQTDGVYVPAGTAALDLESIVDTHLEPLVRDAGQALVRRVPVEHYRWFVLASLLSLLLAVWVGSQSGARRGEMREQ